MLAKSVEANVFHYSAAISACEKGGQWQLALGLLSSMLDMRVIPNEISYNSAISACEKGGQWQQALDLLSSMPDMRVMPTEISCSAAISACEKGEQWQLALGLLSSMPDLRVIPNEISYNSAISACEKGGQWQVALGILSSMPAASVMPDKISYTAAISACEKGGQWQLALGLLSGMTGMRVIPNEISYSAAISACEKGGQWQRALGILSSMPDMRGMPNEISYNAAITACEKGGQWQLALGLLNRMPDMRVIPNEISYNAAISACSKSGQWHQALKLLSMMPTVGAIAWGSVLLSMAMSGNLELQASTMESLRLKWLESASRIARYPSGENYSFGGFRVLLESDGLFAVFKPAGITTEELVARLSRALLSEGHPGEITGSSRLDVETSGVLPLVFGPKSSALGRWLTVQFAARQVSKEYICLCAGPILGPKGTQGEIDNPLQVLKTGGIGTSMLKAVWSSSGKAARTQYEVLEVFQQPLPALVNEGDAIMMLLVRPLTGRTHQIRSHLAGIGRPIVGDADYGGLRAPWCRRVLLHCWRLSLMDLNCRRFQPEAPFPSDLLETLQHLGYDPIAGSCDAASDVNIMMRGQLV
ncbi:unnamed protein product [Polarella glacialis]|uniref:Pseudouridine synthase RsuA/RluA-like domain-containing protein n=1 Tax=Polarella glacialis TaxID=89957 RepID=A0A813G4V3_POLGL|nr:unnamed protein product [Polarella glacialis]